MGGVARAEERGDTQRRGLGDEGQPEPQRYKSWQVALSRNGSTGISHPTCLFYVFVLNHVPPKYMCRS